MTSGAVCFIFLQFENLYCILFCGFGIYLYVQSFERIDSLRIDILQAKQYAHTHRDTFVYSSSTKTETYK